MTRRPRKTSVDREEIGFSYFVLGADFADVLAPVVAKLAGRYLAPAGLPDTRAANRIRIATIALACFCLTETAPCSDFGKQLMPLELMVG